MQLLDPRGFLGLIIVIQIGCGPPASGGSRSGVRVDSGQARVDSGQARVDGGSVPNADGGLVDASSGQRRDAGPVPNDLPINIGDPVTYQGISRTPNGCVSGFIDAQCEQQGSWYLNMTVTDKFPSKATNVTLGDTCASDQALVEPTRDRCATCPDDEIPTLINGAYDLDGNAGPPQVYCLPARGWDNVYTLQVMSEYLMSLEHPEPTKLANSWVYNLAPWNQAQTSPFVGETIFRTNVAIAPRASQTPFPWALDLSKWNIVSQDFVDLVLELDPDAEILRPEAGRYIKALMNYNFNGVAVRHSIEVLYHERGYLCKFNEELGGPAPGSDRRIRNGETGGMNILIQLKRDSDTVLGTDTNDGNTTCVSDSDCAGAFSCRGEPRRCRRLRPRCCIPGAAGCR